MVDCQGLNEAVAAVSESEDHLDAERNCPKVLSNQNCEAKM